jgi:hypothetical protein
MDDTKPPPQEKDPPEPWDHERWTFTVEAAGCGVPTTIRVRRAMKWLLRTHGLRVVNYGPARKPAEGRE